VLLKNLIDEAEPIAAEPDKDWLAKAVSWWKVVASISDYGFKIESTWSTHQIDAFLRLAEAACGEIKKRDWIPADEIENWDILEGRGVYPRGADAIETQCVIVLGQAIIDLIRGILPQAPKGTVWFLGTPSGWRTIAVSEEFWSRKSG
jgi:hypothetical protein